MFVVGLTGGIGSGKSEVGSRFHDLGIKVVNADRIARDVVEPGTPALGEIASHFGNHIILPDGSLDRSTLRNIIFKDPDEKQWLENLLHPLIRQLTKKELASAASPYAILESPLLLEMGQKTEVDRVLVVDVPIDIQIRRASLRDSNNEDQIRAIIASQIPRQDRLALADDIIDNSGPITMLNAAVESLHQKYLGLANNSSSSKMNN